MAERTRIPMVVSEISRGRTIFKAAPGLQALVRGDESGDTDYCCPTCGHVIAEGVRTGSVTNIVFVCPQCETVCEVAGGVDFS